MLVKYLGLEWDEKKNREFPRSQFIENGLFRFTQPKFLNDKGSEAKLEPYYDKYSPVDIEWARRECMKHSIDDVCNVSEDRLIKRFLDPTGRRFGDAFPWMLKHETQFETIKEYDFEQFKNAVSQMNHLILELLSAQIGVFSLSRTDRSEYMWTHYASEGKGIAVVFDENNPFFKHNPPIDVLYSEEDRATMTYKKGHIRINGVPIEDFEAFSCVKNGQIDKSKSSLCKDLESLDLTKRLLFSKKHTPWYLEEETRIVLPLDSCDETRGETFTPDIAQHNVAILSPAEKCYSAIYLKKIPFEAITSIILGFEMDETHIKEIEDKLKLNEELSHISLRKAKYNVFNNIEISTLS
ncbi:DUF2971 domain-containing protein [Vibrio breoganii]|uniref:DUF2971 domain-containing protein n=1 Tax=Vibrio breoganii TaxID=553239 RepID=A0AAP8MVG7_9VIBR|nr:DUF2971 domain-containing protein [Vibrio breoganii]PMP10199.1 hypothetical protein BCS93_11020 [Vibrio breoganii]